MDDLRERVARVEERTENMDTDLSRHLTVCEAAQVRTDTRLATLERLAYIGLGGMIVIGGVMTIIGGKLLKLLGG